MVMKQFKLIASSVGEMVMKQFNMDSDMLKPCSLEDIYPEWQDEDPFTGDYAMLNDLEVWRVQWIGYGGGGNEQLLYQRIEDKG
jgi:hypothetical protein